MLPSQTAGNPLMPDMNSLLMPDLGQMSGGMSSLMPDLGAFAAPTMPPPP